MQFSKLVKFLEGKKQYPFSEKRKLFNKFLSFLSYFPVNVKNDDCDVLFILDSPNAVARYNSIIESIRENGFSCFPIFFSSSQINKLALKGALLSKEVITEDFATQKGFALYLRFRYSPKIILQVDDCSFVSTFIKKFSNAKLINIAHCVSCPTEYFDIFDYHFYFVFGPSSIVNLKKNNNSYGFTKLIQTGSLLLHEGKFNYSHQNKKDGFILFSSQWMLPATENDVIWVRCILYQLALRNPTWKIVVKLHPLEIDSDWVILLPNLIIADNSLSFGDLLSNASFHLTHNSAFALEASLCDVPTVCIQRKDFIENCLGFKEFFPVVDNVDELEKVLKGGLIINENIKAFKDTHLVNIGNELNYFISLIRDIMANNEILDSEDLTGTFYD
jgi:hypothetical protein